jgi:hypothetical protein
MTGSVLTRASSSQVVTMKPPSITTISSITALLLGLDRAQRAARDAVTASRTIEAEEDGCLSCLHDD